jgi:hypothetical protein
LIGGFWLSMDIIFSRSTRRQSWLYMWLIDRFLPRSTKRQSWLSTWLIDRFLSRSTKRQNWLSSVRVVDRMDFCLDQQRGRAGCPRVPGAAPSTGSALSWGRQVPFEVDCHVFFISHGFWKVRMG